MIYLYLYNYHRDYKKVTELGFNAIDWRKIDSLRAAGFVVKEYFHHWDIKPDRKLGRSVGRKGHKLNRMWVEFETEEEAALFKLTHL